MKNLGAETVHVLKEIEPPAFDLFQLETIDGVGTRLPRDSTTSERRDVDADKCVLLGWRRDIGTRRLFH